MKVSRNEFKALVKECLLELLNEGLGLERSAVRPAAAVRRTAAHALEGHRRGERVMAGTSSGRGRSGGAVPSAALQEAINRESAGDPIMASIFADTAKNTLPKMIEGDRAGGSMGVGHDAASRAVAAHAPEQIFGEEMTDRWAALAFSEPRPGVRAQIAEQLDT